MTNEQIKKFCLSLLHADSETDVIQILKEAGYWDDPSCWRYYGDTENNYGQVGNQQARSDNAVVEKVINSVDASLIRRCFLAGIDPESHDAPESIRAAVAILYENEKPPISDSAGRISEWPDVKRLESAQEVTVAITGASARKGNPCITIADKGEGQTPSKMPDTLLSLGKNNKVRIPFVQGKFNMGGTGALEFCGERNLQLVISRRDPALPADPGDDSAGSWGVTVVRRDDPKHGRRNSTYVYLAPGGASAKKPGNGSVLRFDAKSLPLFPDGGDSYVRHTEWGTAIKLYEYTATGYSNSSALMKDGLLRRMDMLLPEIALPVRVHECRKSHYGGKGGSYANNMTGIRTRLDDDKSSNLEMTPSHYPLTVQGESLSALAYAFKRGKADTYVKNEGVVFAVNGQAHGFLTRDFFRRKNVGMSYLADSLLVLIDCSSISTRSREKLFMPSRDRLRAGDLKDAIEDALEYEVKNDERLRELKAKRRQEDIEEKLDESKPLEDVLAGMLKHSPTLSSLLLKGARIPNPFRPTTGKGSKEKPFEGKRFPTFFKFRGKEIDETLKRDAAINRRARIQFETDAEDDYFRRVQECGDFRLWLEVGGVRKSVSDYSGATLASGIAAISVQLPSNCTEGDVLNYVAVVDDKTRVDPIENEFSLTVTRAAIAGSGGNGKKTTKDSGSGEDDAPEGLSLPNITKVTEKDGGWAKHGFNKYSALKIMADDSEGSTAYDFFINVDNLYLKTEMKQDSEGAKLTEAKFIFGMVLLGMGLIHEDMKKSKTGGNGEDDEEESVSVEQSVLSFTRAVAPILIPMIDELGGLDADVDLGVIGN